MPARSQLLIEFDREVDGLWIADIPALPGVMAYGATRDEAARNAQVIALQVLADMLEHNEDVPEAVTLLFTWEPEEQRGA